MNALSLDVIGDILEILDPESRFVLASTCKSIWMLATKCHYGPYLYMASNAPWKYQRLEAIAHEGTLEQQGNIENFLGTSSCLQYITMMLFQVRDVYKMRRNLLRCSTKHRMLAVLARFFPNSNEHLHLAASLGHLDLLTDPISTDMTLLRTLCLTGIIHGHPEILPTPWPGSLLSNCVCGSELSWVDNLQRSVTFPAADADDVRVKGKTCPNCGPAHFLLGICYCFDLAYLSLSGVLVETWPIDCREQNFICVNCDSYHVSCPQCGGLGKFIRGCMDEIGFIDPWTHRERANYLVLQERALQSLRTPRAGLPVDCGELIGPDGGLTLEWECIDCGHLFHTIDK